MDNHCFELLLLKHIPRMGNSRINKEYFRFLSSCNSIDELEEYLLRKGVSEENISQARNVAKNEYETLYSTGDTEVITVFDERYPKQLLCMDYKRPVMLFARGNIKLLESEMIAVIGTRKPSGFTEKAGRLIVKRIVEDYNLSILSGLALGCDTIAHEAALEYDGNTIAILPSGLSNISPKGNRRLAQKIINNNGLVLSEYPNDFEITKYSPVKRDELVAALTNFLLVLECSEKSGTMQTVKYGNTYKKPVGAFITKESSRGNYSGNNYVVNNNMGIPIKTKEDFSLLFHMKKEEQISTEQLSLFRGEYNE